LILWINVAGLLLVAVWFRCRALGNIPGINGDEAWYGVKALLLLGGDELCLQTPTGNPINPFFFGPMVALHALFHPSAAVLRAVAVGSGLVALALNWWLCRRTFDRRIAAISTLVLAVLPINIAYSRFAWDASQTLAFTLPIWYLCLAAVRFPQRRGQLILAAVVVQLAAVIVHPTNIFAGAAIAVALIAPLRWHDLRKVGRRTLSSRPALVGLALATLAAVALVVHWANTPMPGQIAARVGNFKQLTHSHMSTPFWIHYPQLITGGTIYGYVAGSCSWLRWPSTDGVGGWGLDVALFWAAVAAAVVLLWQSWKHHGRNEDRVLIFGWALGLLGFLVVAGPPALLPGYERYAMCLIAPTVLLLSRGAVLWWEQSSRKAQWGLLAVSLAGWFLLADYQVHYFESIHRTGGLAHRTFRTADVEPKQAALATILKQRRNGTTWIVTSEHWNYWPLRYLSMADEDVRVVRPEEVEASPQFERALREGRVWFVEFSGTEALDRAQAALAGRKVRRWWFEDYGGRAVLCALEANYTNHSLK
jgi:hypothetical protein